MPYTIIYTSAPRCSYGGKPMREWTAFAEVHYHQQCLQRVWAEQIADALRKCLPDKESSPPVVEC